MALTGDIHAFFAATPTSRNDGTSRIVEFVTAGISSNPFGTLMLRVAQSDPSLPQEAAVLAASADSLLRDQFTRPNPDLGFARTKVNGYAILEVEAAEVRCTFRTLTPQDLAEDLGAAAADRVVTHRFRVQAGSTDLQQEIDGAWKTWSPDDWDWV